ncbi:MAG: hypothetical protein ACRD7E_27530 [Bryobacteraceae bacterium]
MKQFAPIVEPRPDWVKELAKLRHSGRSLQSVWLAIRDLSFGKRRYRNQHRPNGTPDVLVIAAPFLQCPLFGSALAVSGSTSAFSRRSVPIELTNRVLRVRNALFEIVLYCSWEPRRLL